MAAFTASAQGKAHALGRLVLVRGLPCVALGKVAALQMALRALLSSTVSAQQRARSGGNAKKSPRSRAPRKVRF